MGVNDNVVEKFFQKVRHYGLEYFDRYYGWYKGRVTDNEDPEDRGRVKVKVPILQLDNDGPIPQWAMPVDGPFNRNEGRGTVAVPGVDDDVWVTFQDGNPEIPVYHAGGFFADGDLPDDFDVPDDRGWKTHAGHVVRFRDKDDDASILVEHEGGTKLEMQSDGSVVLETEDGDLLEMDTSGKVTLEHRGGAKHEIDSSEVTITNGQGTEMTLETGEATIESDAKITLDSTQVVLDGSAQIQIGKNATSPLLKGTPLTSWISLLYAWAVGHVHPSAGAPPATPAPQPSVSSWLSKKGFVK